MNQRDIGPSWLLNRIHTSVQIVNSREINMKRFCTTAVISALVLGTAHQTRAGDNPVIFPPHGMFRVEIDANNKLFSNSGAAAFDEVNNPGLFTTNASGHTILGHSVGRSIAEQDGNKAIGNPGDENSTIVWTDDPGFTAGADLFPVNNVLSANFHNSVRYFEDGGTQWTAPPNQERIRVFDLFGGDDTGGTPADLQLTITENTSGLVGTVNIDTAEPSGGVITVTGLHGMLGYELSRQDGLTPAKGAYMIELTLSSNEVPAAGGIEILDSDPIFVVFNNRLDTVDPDGPEGPMLSPFHQAVAAAQALPEPSTAVMIAAMGAAWMGLRRRRCAQA